MFYNWKLAKVKRQHADEVGSGRVVKHREEIVGVVASEGNGKENLTV